MTRARSAGVFLAAVSMVAAQVQVAWAAPPTNDSLAGATVITALPATVQVDVTEATGAASDPNCYDSQHNVWFSYTPETDEAIRYDIESADFAIVLAVFESNGTTPARLRCDYYRALEFEAKAGTTYYFMAGSYSAEPPGQATLNLDTIAPPQNDDIRTARPIHGLPFRVGQSTIGATAWAGDPNCFGSDHTVWFSFTPETADSSIASTVGSDFDSTMGIYKGRPGALKEISCTDNTGKRDDVRRVFKPEAGTRYLIMVGSKNGAGRLDFSLQAALKVTATLGPRGQVHEVTGAARIAGTLVCSGRARVRVAGELRQRHGSDVTTAYFRTNWIKCSPKQRVWHAVITNDERAFTPGEAGLSAVLAAYAGKESDKTRVSRLVDLSSCRCSWGN